MSGLVTNNALNARQLMGAPALGVPSEDDESMQLRRHTLWRACYPRTAPAPVEVEADDVSVPPPSHTHREGEGQGEAETPSSFSSSSPAGQTLGALMVVRSAADGSGASGGVALPSSSPSASGASSSYKRRRGEAETDAPVITVDPEQLKQRHALVVSATARTAATAATYQAPPLWKMSKVLVGHQGWVWTAAVDPTNTWFATGSFDSVIKVWDLATGALKLNLTGHKEAVRGIALSRLSPYMFSGSDDHSVKCWDLERNEIIRDFFGHKSAVHCVAAHPTLDVVVSGGRDKTVRVWDIRTRAAVHTLLGHTDSVMSLVTQQVDPQVISGGSDGFIYLWDLAAGKPLRRLTRHKKPVRGVALNTSGTQLVSCGADEIRVWSLPTGDFLCNASTQMAPNAKASGSGRRSSTSAAPVSASAEDSEELGYRWSSCAMSPRNVLAVASQDGQLAFYDWNRPQLAASLHYQPFQFTKTRSVPGTLPGEGGINCVAYDASGTRLITTESDKSVKVWRVRDGEAKASSD